MSVSSFGAGFALYEYSAKGTAMGGATVANGAEAASLGNNPALITELEGTQIQVGATAVMADATTTVAGQSRSLKDKTFILPNFFITHKWSDDITLGLGGFSRYGLGGEYNDPIKTWAGSNLAYKVNLETFSFTPTIAIKANEELSVAMGLEAMVIGFSQDSFFNATPAIAGAYDVSGSGVNWGGNFSLLYKPEWAEKWSFGALYRTKVKSTLKGRLHSDRDYTTLTGGQLNIHSGDAEGSITLPDFVKTKLRNLENGRILENTFTAGAKIDTINVERRPYQFLYKDEDGFNFMHEETYEQIHLDTDLVDNADLMKEGQHVEMMFLADEERCLTCELPTYVELEVTYTEPAVKGDTASTNAQKEITLETGAIIMAPLFINIGERIRVNTTDRSYGERVK